MTRAQQVEHEALVTLLAQRAGVLTADLVATAATASGDKLLVVDVIAEDVPAIGAAHLDAMWTQLDRLRGGTPFARRDRPRPRAARARQPRRDRRLVHGDGRGTAGTHRA